MENGFKVEGILLMQCEFERIPNVTFGNPDIRPEINIKVLCNLTNDKIYTKLVTTYESVFNEVVEVSSMIVMLGIFSRIGNPDIEDEFFGNVNGPAIIFPYIREQFSNVALKAGLGNILIPSMNFLKMYEDSKPINKDNKLSEDNNL